MFAVGEYKIFRIPFSIDSPNLYYGGTLTTDPTDVIRLTVLRLAAHWQSPPAQVLVGSKAAAMVRKSQQLGQFQMAALASKKQ